ncbi:O-antigen ligase family protein [Cetobacterium sp.]|uniref:O-antigen ligase family protein n=1 Tax=Cetobacterium sp. TaxID=2071632 RepID=UPI003F360C54
MNRERFYKIEEILLYILGLCLFLNFEYTKFLVLLIIIDLIIRKVLFKEELNCGNENIKKFIIWFLIIGMFWNFLGGMNYKPARNFLKISRYIPLLFFLYPLFEKSKKYLERFLLFSLGSYLILLVNVIKEYDYTKPWIRVEGFEGISTTGDIGSIVSLFSFGLFLKEKKIIKKIIYFIIYISGIFVTIATKGRAPLLSIATGTFILLCLEIYSNFSFKKIVSILGLLIIGTFIGLSYLPENTIDRFKTTFHTEKTDKNTSNGLRIEMWKIGIKRVKENPIFGSGTKYDKENLFRKFVEELPDNTEVDRNYKYQLLNLGFNDAHNMYINAAVDNGIYVLSLLIIWFGIPSYLLFKSYKDVILNKYYLSSLGGIIAILIVGAFWMFWRTPEQIYFWVLYSIMLISVYRKEEIEE